MGLRWVLGIIARSGFGPRGSTTGGVQHEKESHSSEAHLLHGKREMCCGNEAGSYLRLKDS